MTQEGNLVIQNIRQGDVRAFKALYDTYYKKLCYHAFKIINRQEQAEEVVQDVFVKIWTKRKTLNLPENIHSYLYRAVLNESLNYVKKSNELWDAETDVENLNSLSEFQSLEINQLELRKNIQTAISKIPSKTRKVFIMNRKHGFSYQEIAERLDISVKGVEYHVCSALKLMRKELGNNTHFLFFLVYLTMG